mmetsp:Transcript_14938/g.37266  ORF Transcript_14938/g.37266 Transcript_14938/m.37266 type:complete len:86 (-) Transcript_14938:1222-1479(-)
MQSQVKNASLKGKSLHVDHDHSPMYASMLSTESSKAYWATLSWCRCLLLSTSRRSGTKGLRSGERLESGKSVQHVKLALRRTLTR